jgi:hypothetical protein
MPIRQANDAVIPAYREIGTEGLRPLDLDPFDAQQQIGPFGLYGEPSAVGLHLTVNGPGRVLAERLGLKALLSWSVKDRDTAKLAGLNRVSQRALPHRERHQPLPGMGGEVLRVIAPRKAVTPLAIQAS